MIKIDIQLFPRHPVRKLLVPINQSSYLICFCYNFFDIAKETNMYEHRNKIEETTFAYIYLFYFSSFIFKKITKKHYFRKKNIVEEELDCIGIDDMGNLEDSPRLVFLDEECGNLLVLNDDRELTRNINQKKKTLL